MPRLRGSHDLPCAQIVTDTVLMAEVLPVRQRGLWLSLINVFFGVGFIVIVLVAWSGCGG